MFCVRRIVSVGLSSLFAVSSAPADVVKLTAIAVVGFEKNSKSVDAAGKRLIEELLQKERESCDPKYISVLEVIVRRVGAPNGDHARKLNDSVVQLLNDDQGGARVIVSNVVGEDEFNFRFSTRRVKGAADEVGVALMCTPR